MVATAKTERDASALARGDRAAREIAGELDALRNEAERLRSEHGERLGGARTKLDEVVAAARATLKETADLAPYPQQIKRRRADLEGVLRELEGSKKSADHGYLEGLSSRLSFSVQQLKEVAAGPPAALADAADAFFAGDFAKVLARLATIADSPRECARTPCCCARRLATTYGWSRAKAMRRYWRRPLPTRFRANAPTPRWPRRRPSSRPASSSSSPRRPPRPSSAERLGAAPYNRLATIGSRAPTPPPLRQNKDLSWPPFR